MNIFYLWFCSYFYPLLLIAKLIFYINFFNFSFLKNIYLSFDYFINCNLLLFIDGSIKINNWNECVILFDIYSDYYKLIILKICKIILPENPLNNNHLLLEWI